MKELSADELGWTNSWFGLESFEELTNMTFINIYSVAFYWSITTLTTIGYGDLSPGILS